MNIKALNIWILIGLLSISGCGAPAAAPAEVETVPSPTESIAGSDEAGFYPLSTRTGIMDIDTILAAVESGDAKQLQELLRFISVACTNLDGLGGPPKCREGEADGTQVDVFPFLGSEGSFLHGDEIENFPGLDVVGMYAAYRVSNAAYSDENYPAGDFAVILVADENKPNVVLQIGDKGILRIDYLFGSSLDTLNNVLKRDASEVILAPE